MSGVFIERTMAVGSSFITLSAALMAMAHAPSKCDASWLSTETAMAWIPVMAASIAAPTVPEYMVSFPRFAPMLIPESTMSISMPSSLHS